MEWLDKLNESIKYIEDNLQGNIDYNKAAKIALIIFKGCFHILLEFLFLNTYDKGK